MGVTMLLYADKSSAVHSQICTTKTYWFPFCCKVAESLNTQCTTTWQTVQCNGGYAHF